MERVAHIQYAMSVRVLYIHHTTHHTHTRVRLCVCACDVYCSNEKEGDGKGEGIVGCGLGVVATTESTTVVFVEGGAAVARIRVCVSDKTPRVVNCQRVTCQVQSDRVKVTVLTSCRTTRMLRRDHSL